MGVANAPYPHKLFWNSKSYFRHRRQNYFSLRVLCMLLFKFFFTLPCRAADFPATANWATYHGDAGLQGNASTSLSNSLSIGWRFKVGAAVSQPPIVINNIIYTVSDQGEVIALDLDGVKLWSSTLPRQPQPESFSTPPLRLDNLLLAGTDKGQLYAFDAKDGALKWKIKIGDDLYGALNWLEPEGTNNRTVLALARNNGSLSRIELTTGHLVWTSKPIGRSDCSPAVGHGIIVFGACDSALHFISPSSGDCLAKTEFNEHGPMAGGTAIDGSQVYAGTRDGSILCADANTFKLLWIQQVASNEIFTTPAVTSKLVLAGSSDGSVVCLNKADGKKVWGILTDGTPTSPGVAGNKVVIVSGGTLSLLSLETGNTLWSAKPCDTLSPPAITNGKIIVGTDDGFIILYKSI